MEIKVLQDFNQFNVSSPRHVSSLIQKLKDLKMDNVNSIILDLTDCQTDYPETPRLIDYFLFYLEAIKGEKELIIYFNGLGNKEVYILHDIVLEGKYFGIMQKINSDEDVLNWKRIMSEKLKNAKITLKIIYSPENQTYIYG